MSKDHSDVEAYAQTDNAGAVLSLLSKSIGPLVPASPLGDELQIYESESVSVIVQPSENGFLSIGVRGSQAWLSCPALGRHLARELRCIVRCDPGCEFPEISPHSSVFLEIEGNEESFVFWG